MADYQKSASGDIHMDVDGMFAQHHSKITSEKVKETLREQRSVGYCTYQAPVGYLNEGSVEYKPFDPARAPIVKRMFELADENWSITDICKWAIEEGFTMPARRPRRSSEELLADEEDDNDDTREQVKGLPRKTTVQVILRNNFYIGLIKGNDGEYVKSMSHEPLVSNELFESVQQILSKKNKSKHYDKPLEWAFRKLFQCKECERSYTPYPKKGILYLGVRCKDGCKNSNKNINETFVIEKTGEIIKSLNYTEKELEELENNAHKDIKRLEKNRLKQIESIENRKKKIRVDLEYLRSEKTTLLRTGAYSPEEYMEEVSSKERELKSLMEEEKTSEEAMIATFNDVLRVSELLKNITTYWDFLNSYEIDKILRIIFSELYISGETVTFNVNLGFKGFENRLNHSGARYHTTLELFETMVNNVEMIRSWNISLKELLEKDYSAYAQKVTF
jgi:site-specific DNA recombinase